MKHPFFLPFFLLVYSGLLISGPILELRFEPSFDLVEEIQLIDHLNRGFQAPDNSHPPILINNNSDFMAQAAIENWEGDGTKSNPYVIEGVTIQEGFVGNYIEIHNTDVHFIISNCVLNQTAIYLHQVSNGHLFNNTIVEGDIFLENSEFNSLMNNTVVNSYSRGIYLFNSGDNVLSYNLVTTCVKEGIHLYYSQHCTLSHNTVTGNAKTGILAAFSADSALQTNIVTNNGEEGICLYFSDNCSVTDNFLMNNKEQGIRLHRSANNVITNNDLGNNRFTVSGGSLKHFIQTEIANNAINGKPLVYWQHVVGGSVPKGAGAIFLVNSSFVSVTGQRVVGIFGVFCSHLSIQTNIVLNGNNGIQLSFSNTSVISNNYVGNSNGVGIYIGVSQDISLLNNTVSNSTREGISLSSSENSSLTDNTVTFNTWEGIYLYNSENSTLINNTVSNNNKVGIGLKISGNSTLMNNTVINNNEEGIYLYRTGNIKAKYNILVNNSFSVAGWLLEHYIQTEITNNLINNKPILYWQHVTNQLIPPGAGMVILVNCSLISVINQQLVGILGAFSSHLFFESNSIMNGNYGIWFEDSTNITISNNSVTNHNLGIFLASSGNSTLTDNTVHNNLREGIFLISSGNSTLINNTVTKNNGSGIRLQYSGTSVLTRNTVINNNMEGILLCNSGNNVIKDNILRNNSFSISGKTVSHYIQAVVASNLLNDKQLVYWQHIVDDTVPSGAGMIILVNCSSISVNEQQVESIIGAYCSNILIQNNEIFNGNQGIQLLYSNTVFISENILFNNDMAGISLEYSHNNVITNNIITNSHEEGVLLTHSEDNILTNNQVAYNSKEGISLHYSENNNLIGNTVDSNDGMGIYIWNGDVYWSGAYYGFNILTNNVVTDNKGIGIFLECSGQNTLINNTILNNTGGIFLYWSGQSILTNNTLINNNGTGILIGYSKNCTINGNYILYNDKGGISLCFSQFCQISANTIHENNGIGIDLYLASFECIINGNEVVNNIGYGIRLSFPVTNTTVQGNDFLWNNLGGVSQAYDDGWNNLFSQNYWSDWTSPDTNNDGIVDLAYPIEGEAFNSDPFPLAPSSQSSSSHINPSTSLTVKAPSSTSPHGPTALTTSRSHQSRWINPVLTGLIAIFITIFWKRKRITS